MTLAEALVLLAAFALGGVLGGRLMGALRGVDLRSAGSGNIGATNALRTQGTAFALTVLAIDAGKGIAAVLLLPLLLSLTDQPVGEWLPYACGAAAVLGHCFSLWHGFNGGKGVATLAGAFVALLPLAFLCMLAGFVLTVLLTGIVSLATLLGGLVALLYVTCFSSAGLLSSAGAFVAAMLLLVLFTHRENWQRLRTGRESRFENARWLGRRLGLAPLGLDRERRP